MVPICRLALCAGLAGLLGAAAQAAPQDTVPCRSHDFGYTECPAPDLKQPQLLYQRSSSACIVNRTWGFDRSRKMLWVDNGCAGRFGDVGGYFHGRTGQFDAGAQRFGAHGEDLGPFVGGEALGAFFEGAGSPPAGDEAKAAPHAPAPAVTHADGDGAATGQPLPTGPSPDSQPPMTVQPPAAPPAAQAESSGAPAGAETK